MLTSLSKSKKRKTKSNITMGLDTNGIKFLLDAKKEGVSFEKSAMVGRQFLYLDAKELQECFQAFGHQLSLEGAKEILSSHKGYAEKVFTNLGADYIHSYDASDYESATYIHDFNAPIPAEHKNKYSLVLDGGTLEHIFHFPNAIQNCMEMLEVGGHFLSITPANNLFGHGFYQFSPELFYRIFSPQNGFEVEEIITFVNEPDSTWYKVKDPQVVKKRVKLINNRETYLLVRAKKTKAVSLLTQPPQQSDYVINYWDSGTQREKQNPSLLKRLASILPSPIETALSGLYQSLIKKDRIKQQLGSVNPLYFEKKSLKS
ncbi:MAG: hypothetical protein AB8H47_14260 [Bacteroidia bacterium]